MDNDYLFALMLSFGKVRSMPVFVGGQNNRQAPQWWYLSGLCLLANAPCWSVPCCSSASSLGVFGSA
jgi:hypothetical protein